MKLTLGLALTGAFLLPAVPASAAPTVTPAPVTPVARYSFEGGVVSGKVADTSGKNGPALTLRTADQGILRVLSGPTGRYVAFPAACPTGTATCPRALLEAANVAGLNPGTRLFRWSARVNLSKTQIAGSSNVLQKGVVGTGSQWKMQIGATNGRAQCIVVGAGSRTVYVARSTATVADSLWHKVLCERNGTALTVFVDDKQAGQTTIPATTSISNTLPLRIGGPNFNARSDMYHGLLDDVYAELG